MQHSGRQEPRSEVILPKPKLQLQTGRGLKRFSKAVTAEAVAGCGLVLAWGWLSQPAFSTAAYSMKAVTFPSQPSRDLHSFQQQNSMHRLHWCLREKTKFQSPMPERVSG